MPWPSWAAGGNYREILGSSIEADRLRSCFRRHRRGWLRRLSAHAGRLPIALLCNVIDNHAVIPTLLIPFGI